MPDAYIVFIDIDQSKKMTHTLSFASIHKSITTLSPTTLPQLVVLTGTNGSGKTHLLTALKQGNVRSDLVNDYSTEVRLFDSNSIIPTDTGVFDPLQDRTRRSQWFNTVRVHREVALPQLQQVAMSLGVPAESCSTLNSIRKLTLKRLEQLLPTPEAAAGAYTHLQNTIKALGANIASNSINQIGDDTWRKFAPRIQANTPESFFLSTEENFFRTKKFLWEDIDPFQQAFGRVFSRYRELIHENDRFTNYPPPEENLRQALTLEEFRQEYGEPPWEFVNSILEVSNLDFRVDHPPMHETTSYEPKLTKVSKTIDMRFQDLSSGEKVLMSFALCLYNEQETRQQKVFPKLLLLDEVDAPLHPSMVVSLLNTIQKVLIEAKGVYVILTTHSPTTVALAPEDAIYTMNPLGPSIDKVTKNYALGLLTAGVPTLSVSFDGRRQVFVESFTDAQLYEALYQRYKMDLRSDRSVVFVEVGRRSINGEEKNAGCEQVARLVTELASAGNRSVIGLLDWDGFREQGRRLFVLSGGIRDGLESLLFDPVLLAATVIRQSADFAVQCRILPKDESYVTLSGWVSSTWQPAVDALQKLVLGIPSNTETIKVFYRNGMALAIRKDYLHLDDHALEEKILSRLGLLIPINRREGGLKRFVVETILQDHPSLVPLDLIETFRALLVSELH